MADGTIEQDVATWRGALAMALADVDRLGGLSQIEAVCCTGQYPTLTILDIAGDPLRPAITWMDPRTQSGQNDDSGSSSWRGFEAQARWLARNESSTFVKAAAIVTTWELAQFWLTGVIRASGRGGPGDPSPELRHLTPLAVKTGSLIGATTRAATALGIPPGLPVYAGASDAEMTCLGAGLVAPGIAVDIGGTSGGFGLCWDRPLAIPELACVPAPVPGLHYIGAGTAAAGRAVEWFASDVLGAAERVPDLFEEALRLRPGAGGLIFLPYLAGERAPIWDPLARGGFVGLTLAHRAPHLVRAIVEGGAFALRHSADVLAAHGARATELRLVGGAARLPLPARIKASVLDLPVVIPAIADAALLGAAMTAAIGAKIHHDIQAAVAAMFRRGELIQSDPAEARRYDELYAIYRRLYPMLAETFHELGALARA